MSSWPPRPSGPVRIVLRASYPTTSVVPTSEGRINRILMRSGLSNPFSPDPQVPRAAERGTPFVDPPLTHCRAEALVYDRREDASLETKIFDRALRPSRL